MPTVSIESAGDHGFDMAHLRRSGAEDLLQLLLEKAGFYENLIWRVRVNEKQPCSGMTPPVSVVRYKEWGIYVRIKPGDNNTCHNVTLILPERIGFKSDQVFSKMKTVEKAFNRNWRKVEAVLPVTVINNGAVLTEETKELITEVSDDVISAVVNEKFDVQGFLKDVDNVKAICISLYHMEMEEFSDTSEFMNRLCQNLSISITGRQGGAMMRSVMNRGLCQKAFVGSRHVGYCLTRKGRDTIKTEVSLPAMPVNVEQPKLDRAQVIRDLGNIAQDIVSASVRLKEIQAERVAIYQKLAVLDREEKDICELVGEGEIGTFLHCLQEMRYP